MQIQFGNGYAAYPTRFAAPQQSSSVNNPQFAARGLGKPAGPTEKDLLDILVQVGDTKTTLREALLRLDAAKRVFDEIQKILASTAQAVDRVEPGTVQIVEARLRAWMNARDDAGARRHQAEAYVKAVVKAARAEWERLQARA